MICVPRRPVPIHAQWSIPRRKYEQCLLQPRPISLHPCCLSPPSERLRLDGTPVGSYSFMTEFVNKTTDGIIRELDQLQEFIEGPNRTMRASAKIIYTMIRQCSAQQLSYLLRTCPPSTTLHAARRLDAAIATAVYRITDSTKFLPPVESAAMQNNLNRLYLSIRLGGDGMMNSEEIPASMCSCNPTVLWHCLLTQRLQ